jgi:hypothetical protein
LQKNRDITSKRRKKDRKKTIEKNVKNIQNTKKVVEFAKKDDQKTAHLFFKPFFK